MKIKLPTKQFFISAAVLFSFSSLSFGETQATVKPKYVIKWEMAHYPVKYFQKTAEAFRKEVREKSNGEMDVEISVLKVNPLDRKAFFSAAADKVQSGEITMAQVYTHDLAKKNPSLYVFSLPFLFENHEHMAAAMESPEIGGPLLASLSDSGLKGLGFTYSGGYLVVVAKDKEINRIEDFQDLQYRRLDNPVWIDSLTALGVQHFPQNLRRNGKRLSQNEAFKEGIAEAADCTYVDADELMFKFDKKKPLAGVLNETKHTFLTTALIMNEKFFKDLPKNYQTVVQEAAVHASRFERQIVIEDEAAIRKAVAAKYKVVTMSPAEMTRFKDALAPVVKKYEPVVGKALVEKVRKLKEKMSQLAQQ